MSVSSCWTWAWWVVEVNVWTEAKEGLVRDDFEIEEEGTSGRVLNQHRGPVIPASEQSHSLGRSLVSFPFLSARFARSCFFMRWLLSLSFFMALDASTRLPRRTLMVNGSLVQAAKLQASYNVYPTAPAWAEKRTAFADKPSAQRFYMYSCQLLLRRASEILVMLKIPL